MCDWCLVLFSVDSVVWVLLVVVGFVFLGWCRSRCLVFLAVFASCGVGII